MKKWISLLLTLLLLLPVSCAFCEASEADWEYERDLVGTYDSLYEKPILAYYNAILNKEDFEALEEAGLSMLCLYYPGQEGLDTVGCGYYDLDGDGYMELVIGIYPSEAVPQFTVLSVYGLTEKNEPYLICKSAERDLYTLYGSEADSYYLLNQASNSAFNSFVSVCSVKDGALKTLVTMEYDSEKDPEHPWTMTVDEVTSSAEPSDVDELISSLYDCIEDDYFAVLSEAVFIPEE